MMMIASLYREDFVSRLSLCATTNRLMENGDGCFRHFCLYSLQVKPELGAP